MDPHADFYWRAMRKGWNTATAEYDRSWVALLRERTVRCVEAAALRPGEHVLDVACGTGAASFLAAERVGPGGRVIGTDFSHEMVASAAAHAAERGVNHAMFERQRMEQLELRDGLFDAAVCCFGLFYASPFDAALAEMLRVLKPGGRLSVVVWGRRDRCGFRDVFGLIGERVGMDVCPLFFALGPPGALSAALEASGFVDVVESRDAGSDRFTSGEEACRVMFGGGPLAAIYEQMGPEVRADLDRAYLAALAPHRSGDGYAVPHEVVYATARRRTA